MAEKFAGYRSPFADGRALRIHTATRTRPATLPLETVELKLLEGQVPHSGDKDLFLHGRDQLRAIPHPLGKFCVRLMPFEKSSLRHEYDVVCCNRWPSNGRNFLQYYPPEGRTARRLDTIGPLNFKKETN
jgi:hypothetical protein